MKRLIFLVLFSFLFVHPTFAEPKAIDPADQTAEELMAVLELEKGTNDFIIKAVDTQIKQDPRAAAAREKMYDILTKYVGWNAIHDDVKNIWKGQFTDSEMRELINFYKSPIGKKYIHVQVSILDQVNIAIQQRMTQHLPELMQVVQEEVKRAGAAQPSANKPH